MLKSKFSLFAAAAMVAIAFVFSCQEPDSSQIEADISTAKVDIINLKSELDILKMNVDNLYSKIADTSSILDLRERIDSLQKCIDLASIRLGNLSDNFDETWVKVNEKLDSISHDINELRSDIESRLAAVDDFADSVRAFEDSVRKMVRSVVFVPRHTGGCAVVKTSADLESFTLDYEVFPEGCAEAIYTSWKYGSDILSLCYRDVSVRSGLPVIPITEVNFNKESRLLEVTARFKNSLSLVSGDAVAVSLNINTGIATVASPFTDVIMPHFVDLSAAGTANCYIVSGAGDYKFKATVKGNGNTPDANGGAAIADADTAVVLWESLGLGSNPEFAAGALVNGVVLDKNPDGNDSTNDDCVLFTATSLKGNAVIAVKDSEGDILWSWHIWLTDAPEKQVYANNAGVMMDRNLGATSAEKGNPRALGLLYQWGRKDPFLGSSDIFNFRMARSVPDDCWETVEGPKTPEESAMMPTTFITGNSNWTSQNDHLWMSEDSVKTIYDPCPVGWRVPDGGMNGVWKTAANSLTITAKWDSSNQGIDFARNNELGVGIIWYPAAGCRNGAEEKMNCGTYWSRTPKEVDACYFTFDYVGIGTCITGSCRANGHSVRCIAE